VAESFRIDPWASGLKLEYEKLFKYFGVRPFSDVMDRVRKVFGEPHYLMRRGVVFAHRDFDVVLDAYERGEPTAVVTGFMPSGRFHIGHLMVVEQLKYYQQLGFHLFIVLADAEAYAVRKLDRKTVIETALYEYVANMIALGLDLSRNVTVYFQSNYEREYYRLIQMFSRKVTMSEMEAIYGTLEPGKIMAALTQAADILHPQLERFGGYKYIVVPVGAEQDPHLRLTRDLADRFKRELGLNRPASTYHKLVSGLDGLKMSSSRPEYAIFLTDPPEEAARKLKRALTGGRATVQEQRKLGGLPERCMVYEMYVYFLLRDDRELARVFGDCKAGKLLCGPDKDYAAELLVRFLEDHQKRLEKAKNVVEKYVEPPSF
jgi:tryptophanyl-tRNA synthetase